MDKALKQRLVGASVLIALAVIVLPMLLSGRPESASPQTQSIELPPRPDELSFQTRRFPIAESRDNSSFTADQGVPGETSLPEKSAGVAAKADGNDTPMATAAHPPEPDDTGSPIAADPAAQQAEQKEPDANAEPARAVAAPSPARGLVGQSPPGRYVVQVASLGSSENASRLMVTLQKKGLPVLLDTIDSEVGRLNRIRVGPFTDEAEATGASARIAKEVAGVNPKVVDLQPDQSQPESGPTDSLARWVVQVGSFADSSNAQRLVTQLREAGMSAYQETVTSASSSVFRVRVGPFVDREEAVRIQKQLSDRLAVEGVVMTAD